ncbi:Ig-like domain-containing protein [Mycolicibacterium rutilum]|uniref:Ig-like domain-containing protein n=1 Tax=Mycolicibacterium rutilum TaxID=370526 RepID=UPI0012FF639F|nr:Ig-like domain-containing protein [Mycolicibacterium rutilum]
MPGVFEPATATNYSRYVGRVGALAVALGIGAVVSTGHGLGVAHAETDTTSDNATSPDNASTTAESTDPTDPTDPPAPASSQPSGSTTTTSGADEPTDNDTGGMQVGSSGGLNNSTNDAGQATDQTDTAETSSPTTEPEPETTPPTDPVAGAGVPETPPTPPAPSATDPTNPTEAADTVAPPPRRADNESPSTESDSPADELASTITTVDTTSITVESAADLDNPLVDSSAHRHATSSAAPTRVVNPLQAVLAAPKAIVDLAHNFVASLLAPIFSHGPSAPAQPPLLWAILDFVRREVQRTFFNRTPIVVPQEITLVLPPGEESGPITFHVHDFDGDGLKYYVPTQGVPGGPSHGSVTVDQATGTFTYTPDEGFTGVDEFRLTASDGHTRPHLHGLLGFLRPNWGHTDSALIRINVVAAAQPPTAANDSYITDQGGPITGNVLANDVDPNGGNLVTTVVRGPQHGRLMLATDGSFSYEPDPDYHGADEFVYTAFNGEHSSTALVTITINPVNRAPVGVDDAYTTAEDTAVSGNVLTNDSDPDGDSFSAVLDTPASHGDVQLNADGSFTYTPHANYSGRDEFSYVASDGNATGAPTVVTITVTAVQDAPVATPDAYTINEDSKLTGNVLFNDTDADGDALSATLGSGPANGTLHLNADGSFSYTPNPDFSGSDSFSYTVSDGNGNSATGTVSITVTPVNDAPVAANHTFETAEDGTLNGDVLPGATDADGNSLSAAVFSEPTHGTLQLNADGTFTYTPAANFYGTDSFSYTLSDGQASSAPALVVISVTPVNDAPVAHDDAYSIVEDSILTGNVLSNDVDIDRDSLTASLVSGPASGTLVLNPDGTFTYTPVPNYSGTVSFTYEASDGSTTRSTGVVTITVTAVNDAPVAGEDFFTTPEDTAYTGNVLNNDSDAEGDKLTVSLVDQPAHGTVTLAEDGTFTYTPAPNFSGLDHFTYTTFDGTTTTAPTIVLISVTPVNDPPTANPDSYTINEDSVLAGNVLSNDADPDKNNLTAHLVDGPDNGTLTLNSDGTFTYTPNTGYNGTDSFTYTASDGSLSSGEATVTITIRPVNHAPVAVNDAFTTDEDTAATGNVLLNDTDSDGDPRTAQLVSGPANGILTLNADGTFTYTPNANFHGTDSFTYKASDTFATSNTATVTITVNPVNDLPVAGGDSYTIGEDTVLTGNVRTNDTDADGDPLTVELLSNPASGTLTLSEDGSFTYTPTRDFHGIDSFTYTVSDGKGGTAVGTVSITINPANDAPVADNGTVTVDEDSSYTGALPVSDVDSDDVTTSVVVGPAHGELVLHDDGTYTYTPDADFNGTDSFTYRATDGDGAISTVATISITVDPVNDAPVAGDGAFATDEDTPHSGSVPASDIDAGDTVTTIVVDEPLHGTVELNTDGTYTYTPDENWHGTDSFTYRATDSGGASTVGMITITVNSVNDAPVTTDTSVTIDEDHDGYSGTIPVSDVDAGDTYTVVVDRDVANGTLVLNTDGTYTYTPTENFNGDDSFTYTVTDSHGDTTSGTVSITVNAVNDAPVTTDTSVTIDEDHDGYSGTIPVSDVDAGDTYTVVVDRDVANGTLVLNTDGTYTYTPTENFNGDDSFTYTVTDSHGDTTSGTVSITVNAVNDAPVADDHTFTIDEDMHLEGSVPVTDVDDDPTVTLVSGPAHGTLTLNPDGTFTYTPNANYNGTDSFTYTASDDSVTTEVATITIEINPVDDAPIAMNDGFTTDEDSTLDGNVALNDKEFDGQTVTTTLITGPANGTLTLNPDGSFTYTPNANFSGTDSFTYRTSDGTLTSNTALVTIAVIAVNDAPVANDDAFTTNEDTQLSGNVLVNDTDPDRNSLGAVLVSGPSHGTLTLNADGTFTYTPNANYSGTDSFTYTAGDGSLSDEAVVTISVTAVNDTPVAVNDNYTVDEDTPLTGNVIGNDVDADNDTLTAVVVSGPAHGTLNLNPDGTFTYTPTANYSGTDSFTYTVTDPSTATSNIATVSITVNAVNDPPVANNDSYTTNENTPLTGNVVNNDTDADGNTVTAVLAGGPSHGTVTLNADGSFTYTPTANYSGTDSFTYTASDGQGGTATGTVNITINAVNNAPVASNDSFTTNEDTPATGNVLTNDTDADGDSLEAVLVSGPDHGTLTLNADGSFTYTPNANYHGTDKFYYRADDGTATSATKVVTITIEPVNDPPVANNDSFTVNEDTTYNGNVLSNDTDVDGDSVTVTVGSGPSHGNLTLNANGTFTYTPSADYNGPDSFTYTASDDKGGTATGTVTITVTPVNDAPVANNDTFSGDEDTQVTGNVLTNDTDPDGKATIQSASVVTGPANGTLTFNPQTGAFTYTPNANYHGTDSFTYTISDGAVTSDTATVTITINAVNDAPVANNDTVSTKEDTAVNGNVLTNDTDVDGNPLTAHLVNGPSNGVVTLNPNGTFTYTPAANHNGPDSFTYNVTDGQGGTSNTATVTIAVTAVNDPVQAVNDVITGAEDGGAITGNVLTNDNAANVDVGETLTVVPATGTTANGGTWTVNASGQYSYTPKADFNGTDTFNYTVSDGTSTSTGTVTINVTPVNDRPVVSSPTLTYRASGLLGGGHASGNLLSNIHDVDSDDVVRIRITSQPVAVQNGVVNLNLLSSFTVDENTGVFETRTLLTLAGFKVEFKYVAYDQHGAESDEVTVTVNVPSSLVLL